LESSTEGRCIYEWGGCFYVEMPPMFIAQRVGKE